MTDAYCLPCAVSLHVECISPVALDSDAPYFRCCCWLDEHPEVTEVALPAPAHTPEEITPNTGPFERKLKEDETLKDQTSTGRKRAVKVIEDANRGADGTVCEWAYLAHAGGGAVPIIGCRGNIVRTTKKGSELPPRHYPRNIHHGPDKSTTNNTPENLHVICPNCHNRWHGLNDSYYGERPNGGEAYLPATVDNKPHDSTTTATPDQLDYSDTYWGLKASIRVKVPYQPPKGASDGQL